MKTANEQAAELRMAKEDAEKAVALCRMIRDNENAAAPDRLKAIEILESINRRG